jgi:hypothetical protein
MWYRHDGLGIEQFLAGGCSGEQFDSPISGHCVNSIDQKFVP